MPICDRPASIPAWRHRYAEEHPPNSAEALGSVSVGLELSDAVLILYVQRMYMSTKRVNFRLPEELVTHADIAAEVTHKNRTEILIEALRQYLDEMESDEGFREAVVELYLDEEIEFATLAEVIGRQNAESVRASKQVLDRGEELADKLADL